MKLKKFIVAVLALVVLCVSIPTITSNAASYVTCDRFFTDSIYTGTFTDQVTRASGSQCTVYVENFAIDGVATNISEFTFEWYKDGQKIDGEASNRLTFILGLSANYTCMVYKDNRTICSTDFKMNADTISVNPMSSHKIEDDGDTSIPFVYVYDCIKETEISLGVEATSVIENANLTYKWIRFNNWTGEVSDTLCTDRNFTVKKDKGNEYYHCIISDGSYEKTVMFMLMPNNTLDEKITINGVTPKRFERGHMAVAKVGDKVTLKVETTSTNGNVSYRWEKVEMLFDETQGYYNKITDLGTSNSVTVTKQDADDIYGFEQFECYIEDGNEIVNIGFVLFLLDPNQVTTETTISKNTPAVSLDNTVEDLTNSILQDEMEALQAKETATITLTAESQQNLSADEQSAVDSAISNNDKIGSCIDINLYKQIDNNTTQVTETAKEIALSVEVPKELINANNKTERTYKIIRIHDGKADVLDCNFDAKNGSVSFTTDKFSTYVLTYSDTTKTASVNGSSNNNANGNSSQNIDTSTKSPSTGDSVVTVFCALICTVITITISFKKVFSVL